MEHPRIKFAFLTSILKKNIGPIIDEIFKDDPLFLKYHLFAIFDHEYKINAPDGIEIKNL